jgi:type III secretion system YscI/HrpB-like protein
MEIGSVASQALQSALTEAGASTTAQPPGSKLPGEASPDAAAALEQAMQDRTAPIEPAVGSNELPTAAVTETPGVHRTDTLGDRILQGLGQMNQDAKTAIDHVQSVGASGGDLNAGDLVKAQMSLAQISIQQDITAKVVGKATQTIDTFLKNQ